MAQHEISEDEDEFMQDLEDGTAEVINITDHPVKFEIDGTTHVLKSKEIRRFQKAYVEDHKFQASGATVHGAIRQLTGDQVLPITHKNAKAVVAALRGAQAAKK